MTAIFPEAGPRLFALPPGADFGQKFAEGFYRRVSHVDPLEIARTQILVNTSQAQRVIEHALADGAPRPGPLPRLVLMSDLHQDPTVFPDIAPAISPLRRRLRLTRLIEGYLAARRQTGVRVAPLAAAPDLAESLALLIDQFHDEGIAPQTLKQAIEDSDLNPEAAEHWNLSLSFMDLIRTAWPALREEIEQGTQDPRERQRAIVERMVARWEETPPETPVIAAASTGSVGSTALLLDAISRLPQGCVVLPGFDPDTDPEIWRAAGADHPLGPFREVFRLTGLAPHQVKLWQDCAASPRLGLLAQALRPAPVTDHWHEAAEDLSYAARPAMQDLTLIDAETPAREADAIAVAIRKVLAEAGRTVALVTPDATLCRRVAAALSRFGVVPDDTVGQPLHLSPPAVFLRLLLDVAAAPTPEPVAIAALLYHPLMVAGTSRERHLAHARAYERGVLRRQSATRRSDLLPDWPDAEHEQATWLETLLARLTVLRRALSGSGLASLVAQHRETAEAFCDEGDGPRIWQEAAGEALAGFLDGLERQADAYGEGGVADYRALMLALMRGEQVRPKPRAVHPRVSFIGPRESRLETADVVILAGLNDGVWPRIPDPGPWLSRPMHEALGLPLPERSVGLSAHDFLSAACRPKVILTRSRKVDGAATVASRWLIRLETLLKGVGEEAVWRDAKDRGAMLSRLAMELGRPDDRVPRAVRPRPVPPLEVRPRRLSVTDLEMLIRDAYAIYAKHVLGLRPLDPLGRRADARDRGLALHRILDLFIQRTTPWPGEATARHALLAASDEVLAATVAQPELRRAWRARIERCADWLIAEESRRRHRGSPAETETQGRMVLDLPGGPFEIHARADRIDRLQDGTGAVFDYKTGSPPSTGQIKAGFNHQIHVQAEILARGGFGEIDPLVTSEGAYIGLSGDRGRGAVTEVADLAEGASAYLERLITLLDAYDTGTAYVSRGRPELLIYESDYDHLARYGEWSGEDPA